LKSDHIMKIDEIDDNVLGMFVDGELGDENCEVVLAAMEDDPEIRENIYELRRAKDLMKLGFCSAKAPTRTSVTPKTGRFCMSGMYGMAASVLILVVSFGAGYLGFLSNGFLSNGLSGNVEDQVVAPMAQDRVLLHISESDPKKFMVVLDYARKFLDKHRERGSQVSVVANAGGLDMMREGVSPVKDEVLAMMQEYRNIHFIACANSIRALRKKGIEPVILKNIDTSKPAMEQIIKHVRDGWSYIRVRSVAGETVI